MKLRYAFLLALSGGPVFAAEAPFCLVNNSGQASCFYYSLDACQQARRSMGGLCSANTQQPVQHVQPHTQMQYPDVAGNFQRSYQAGQQMKQQREAHDAQMRLLDAQIAEAEARARTPAPAPSGAAMTIGTLFQGKAVFLCADSGSPGNWHIEQTQTALCIPAPPDLPVY